MHAPSLDDARLAVDTMQPVIDAALDRLATVDVEVFHSFGPRSAWVQRLPWLARARVSLGVDNLLGEKLRVRDALGVTPAGSSADELDPFGRVVYAEFRRLVR